MSTLAASGALGAIAAAIILYRPAFGVYAAVACAPLHVYRHAVGPMNVSLFRVAVLLLALSLVFHLALRTRELRRTRLPATFLIVGALSVAYVATAALESQQSLTGLGTTILGQRVFFLGSMLVVAAAVLHLALALGTVARVAFVSSIPPFLLALYQWAIGDPSQSLPLESLIDAPGSLDVARAGGYTEIGLRPAATFSDPNFLAIYAAMTFVLADRDRADSDRRWRVISAAVQLLSVVVIIITASRTGVLMVACYLFLTRVTRWTTRRRLRISLATAGASFALVFAFVPGTLAGLGRGNVAASTDEHLETRAAALGIGLSHPLRGVGVGNLGPLLGQAPDRSSAHSLPFTVFAEEGALGLTVVLLLLGLPFALLLRRHGRREALGLSVTVTAAVLLYDFVFVIDVAAVWWAFLLASGLTAGPVPERRAKLRRAWRNVGESANASPA